MKRERKRLCAFACSLTLVFMLGVRLTAYALSPVEILLDGASVNENSAVGTVVGTITAADSEAQDVTGHYICSLPEGYGDNAQFQLDGTTLKTNAVFDYETESSYSVTVRMTDADGSYDQEFTIEINDVDESPVANGGSFSIDEDSGTYSGTLTAQDEDTDTELLTYSLVRDGAKGGAVVYADGSFTYTPDADANGDDSFTFRVSDGNSFSSAATVTVQIAPLEDAPVITTGQPVAIETAEDTLSSSLTLAAFDADSDPLAWSVTEAASHGTAGVNEATGAITYTPGENYNGSDSFTVTVSDGNGGTDSVTVTVTVNAVNDPPVNAEAPSFTGTMHNGQALTASAGTWNDDLDGNPGELIYSYRWQRADDPNGTGASDIAGATGQTYVLISGDNGKFIRVAVTCTDGGEPGSESTQAFSPWREVTNTAPSITTGQPVAIETAEDMANSSLTLVASDEDSDSLTWSVTGAASHGTAAVNGTNGAVTYTPSPDYNGSDSFTVTVSDGNGGTDSIAVTVTVDPVNDPPSFTAGADQTVLEDAGPQTVAAWAKTLSAGPDNESGQSLNFIIVSVDRPELFYAGPEIDSMGVLTYIPASNAFGTAVVTVALQDDGGTDNGGANTSQTQTFRVTIQAVNDPPVNTESPSFTGTMHSGQALTASAGTWSDDLDGNPGSLSYSYSWQRANNAEGTGAAAITGAEGQTYTLTSEDNGKFIRIIVTCTDGGIPGSESAQASSPWREVLNAAPAVTSSQPVTLETDEDTAGALNLAASDQDSDALIWSVTGAASHGTAAVNGATGAVTYTPAPDYNGSDTFTVTVSDGNGGTDIVTVAVTVNAVNDPPVNTDAPFFTGTMHNGQVLTASAGTWNDDSDGNPGSLSYSYRWQRAGDLSGTGAADIEGATGASYLLTPADNDHYIRVVVTCTDEGTPGNESTSAASAWKPVLNAQPVISQGDTASVTLLEDASDFSFSLGASDGDGDTITWSVSSNGTHGTASVSGTGVSQTVSYIPDPDFFGTDSFTVAVTDGNGGTDSITVAVAVTPVNDAPSFTSGGDRSVLEDAGTQTVTNWATGLSAGPANESEQNLSFQVSNNNTGLFAVQPAISPEGTLTYTPAADKNGSATVTVTLSDTGGTANGGDNTADARTFTITITAVNDAPSFNKGANQAVSEDCGAKTVAGWATSLSAGPDDEAGQELAFHLTNDNTGLFTVQPAISSQGTLSYTPAPDAFGTATVTVYVQDDGQTGNGGADCSAEQTFTITVAAVNDAPTMTDIDDFSVDEDSTSTKSFTIYDVDNAAGSLILSFDTSNTALLPKANIILGGEDGSHTVTLIPVSDRSGVVTVTLTVRDAGGLSATQSFIMTINAVNDAPTLGGILDRTADEDTVIGPIGLTIGDIDTDPEYLTVTAVSSNPELIGQDGINIIGSGLSQTITLTPLAEQSGTTVITVTLSDGSLTAVKSFTVTVNPVNDRPVISDIANRTIEEDGTTGEISFTVSDVDNSGDELTVTASTDNTAMIPRANITPVYKGGSNWTITVTPLENKFGTAVITVTVKDPGGLLVTDSFTLTVTSVNDTPVLGAISSAQSTNEDTVKTISVTVSDVEDSGTALTLSYAADNMILLPEGSITFEGTGAARTIRINPAANLSGTADVTVTLTDSGGLTAARSFTLTVNAVNDKPSFTAGGSQTIREDDGAQTVDPWAGNISAGPSDEAGQELTFHVSNDNSALFSVQPAVSPAGILTYTPAPNANGSAIVSVTLSDDGGGTDTSAAQTFTITVTPVNDAPVAQDMSFSISDDANEDKSISGALLAADQEHDALIYTVTDQASHGTVTLTDESTGAFLYEPAENFYGTDAFQFKVNDSELDSNTATVTIHVEGVNDPPSAGAASFETSEDTPCSGTLTATDIDSSTLIYYVAADPQHGSISLNSNTGFFTYTPNGNYYGVDRFTFRVSDGALFSNTAMVTITISPVNDAPTALSSETIYLDENQVLCGMLKASDTEGNALTYAKVSGPSHGTLQLSAATGVYTYTPDSGFTGADSFTFTASDASATSNVGQVNIIVDNVNQRPHITDTPPVVFSVEEDDTSFSSNVSASDPDGDALNYSIESWPSHGTLTLTDAVDGKNTDGGFTYVPDSNFNGTDRFTYTATDGEFYTCVYLATIHVTPLNDAPVAYNRTVRTPVSTPFSGSLSAFDIDGDALTYSVSGEAEHGSVTVNADGTFTFTPEADYTGSGSFSFFATDENEADSNVAAVTVLIRGGGVGDGSYIEDLSDMSIPEDTTGTKDVHLVGFGTVTEFTVTSSNQWLLPGVSYDPATYRLSMTPELHRIGSTVITVAVTGTNSDGETVSDIASFILNVTFVNHSPTANGKSVAMDENTEMNEFVTGSDANGDLMNFAKATDPAHGMLTFSSDGTFVYVPSDDYYGTDSFTFTATDSHGAVSAAGTVTISVRQVAIPPVADSGTATTSEDRSVSGTLSGRDRNGGEITFEKVGDGVRGTVVISSDGSFTYTPYANYNGTDVFTFKVKTSDGLYSNIATVTVTITPVNDIPVATVKTFRTDEDQTLTGFLQGTDAEGSSLTFALADPTPSKGKITLTESTGAFTYEPFENANGKDSFWFIVNDGSADSAAVEIVITIDSVNDPPSAANATVLVDEDGEVSGSLYSLVSDVDTAGDYTDAQTFFLVQNGSKGTAAVDSDGNYTYTPSGDVNGTDYFSYKTVDSGGLSSNIAIVSVTINPVNDTPTITSPTSWPIGEDTSSNRFNFTVGDVEDSTSALQVTAVSDNEDVIPGTGLSVNGSAADLYLLATPVPHAKGTAHITITVTDSGKDGTLTGPRLSASQVVTVTVTDVNDKPTIDGKETDGQTIASVTIDEDHSTDPIPFTIGDEEDGTDLTVTAASNNATLVSTGIELVGSGANRTVTVTPNENQNGQVRITVTVKDSGNAVRYAYVYVTVRPVNDPPVVSPPSDQTIKEDSATETLYFTVSDIDSSVENITMTGESLDESKVLSSQVVVGGNGAERTVKVTPLPDANGDVVIRLIANDHDGGDEIGYGTFTLHITPVNDAPTIATVENQTTNEDTVKENVPFAVNDIDSSIAGLTITPISGNTSLITADRITITRGEGDGDRLVTFDPLPDQNGSALITLVVSDGSKTSTTSFTLTVNPVNDPPTISAIADQTILEEGSTSVITFTVGDIDNDVTDLLVTPVSGDTGVIPTANIELSGNGAERTVKVTPAANQNGSIEIQLTVTDPGKLSSTEAFTVHITPVNDEPYFTPGADQTVLEDAGLQTVSGWATGISKGQENESGQVLTFHMSTSNDGLFSALPAVDPATGDLTFTPAANANGSATVTVILSDDGGVANGGDDSYPARTFTITVTPVNDAPSFTKGGDQTVAEDCGAKTVTGWASSLSTGPSDESGQTLSFQLTNDNNGLFSVQPAISPAGVLTYTPKANANGEATVTVTLSDSGGVLNGGDDTADTTTFKITVTAVNDKPVFNLLGNRTVLEDCGSQTVTSFATGIGPGGGSDESSQSLTFETTNSNNPLFSAQPSVALNGTLTYTPAADANGSATVTVRLTDSGDGTNVTTKTFTITVTAVNDAPSFVKGADQTVAEDAPAQTVTGWATALSKGPSDESGQTLSFQLTNSNNGLFSVQPALSPAGVLTYTPASNANGEATVTVILSDSGGTANGGDDTADAQTFKITVTAVNDAPVFDLLGDRTVLEDCGSQSVTSFATGIGPGGGSDEASQTLTFETTNSNNALFSTQPSVASNGTLTFAPADNANGEATVTVKLTDSGDGANYIEKTFSITVSPVNDVPSFTKGSDRNVLEDCGAQTVSGWAANLSKGPSDESGQTLGFVVSTSNDGLFSIKPAIDPVTGALTFTPAANANGEATVTVTLSDNGGTLNGGDNTADVQTFKITVAPVNDAPSFAKGSDQIVTEDCGAQTVTGWATTLSKGPSDESGQTLGFEVNTSNNGLFSALPAIDPATGTLTYTPAANANGEANVTVTLIDNGGTENGGEDTSPAQSFKIMVSSVNDPPVFDLLGDQAVLEDCETQTVSAFAIGMNPGGGSDETIQALTFETTNNNHSLFSAQPSIASDGTLTFTPADNANGEATVTVKLTDSGTGANETAKTVKITVTAVNDAPTFTKGGDQTVSEDCGAQTVTDWATAISRGPSDESGQALSFKVNTSNDGLFSALPAIDPASGTLTYTPAANANGEATVTVTLSDSGGVANGGDDTADALTFKITVNPVNDPPVFALLGGRTVPEDCGVQTAGDFATGMNPGGGSDEAAQALAFETTNSNNALFSVQPSVASNGTLTFTPAGNANGEATVTVKLTDSGDGTNVTEKFFTITVTPVNDAPSFTPGPDETVGAGTGERNCSGWASSLSVGAENEGGQVLHFELTASDESLFAVLPAIDPTTGTLTFTPASGVSGTATVSVVLYDDGGTSDGGSNASEPKQFTITIVGSSELVLTGTVTDAETGEAIGGASVSILDSAGNELRTTVSGADGAYQITGLTSSGARLTVLVSASGYNDNSRVTEISFARSVTGTVREDFQLSCFVLELTANPSEILGDGKDKTTLTATVKDKAGNPISGVLLTFQSDHGSFKSGSTSVTGSDGAGSVVFVSEKLSGTDELRIPVTVTVNDSERKLYGTDRIFERFVPGFVAGVVTDGDHGNRPVEGATVTVYKDFDGNGTVDFSATVVTGADGKYHIAIPRGSVSYNISITKPVTVGDTPTQVTVGKTVDVGDVTGSGDETTNPAKSATGIVVQQNTDGSAAVVRDLSSMGMSLQIVSSSGGGTDEVDVDAETGVFDADNLTPGDYTLQVVYKFGEESEIIVGSTQITITEDGEMNISQILIDPYGTITDSVTGEVIEGAVVTLYYANTQRNRDKGITPDTPVSLPSVSDFPPADNANPQNSDAEGKYAFLVYPDTDYYLTAKKEGYVEFSNKSEPISVGSDLVHYSFEMIPYSDDYVGAAPISGIGYDAAISISSEKSKVEENGSVALTISYGNKSDSILSEATVKALIPDGMTIADSGGGKVSGDTVTWTAKNLGPGEIRTLVITLQAGTFDKSETFQEISASITSSKTLINPEDDQSSIRLLIYSNRYGGIHERYFKGYPDGTFRPDSSITRAEAAAVFARLLKLDVGGTEAPFSDVPSNYWAVGYISAVSKVGLMNGYLDGTFKPDQPITREEFAVIIARYLDIDRPSSVSPLQTHFSDISGSWAESTIEEVFRYAVTNGYTDGTFRPANQISRAEAATMLNRMLYRGPVNDAAQTYPDASPGAWYYGQVEEASVTHSYTVNEDGTETVTEWIQDELR